jgi:alcohol dehydrogenase (cytochrome c)
VAAFAVAPAVHAAPVTADALRQADANRGEWLMYGRTYANWRFSPLGQITPQNVAQLRPVFAFSTSSLDGLEATPLVHEGRIYFSADHAKVFALDARTGKQRWSFVPKEPEGLGTVLCCGPVNRGLAIRENLVYVQTLDAHLVALNKDTGEVAWDRTLAEWKEGYSSTGAPMIVKDMVISGVAGAEYGIRGFVKAFDAKSGAERWTTYVVPGPGEPGNDSWPGDTWKTGGGATWQPGVYDPELNQLYWGTGNPGPWNSDLRKGDNKWTSSIVSLDPDTGKINWGFQYTPNDAWDYDGNNGPVLVDIQHGGKPVKALVQSNRNGFLYALDRTNGAFLYATPTVQGINWTTGLDPKTGRPAVNEAMRPLSGGKTVEPIVPGLEGGTNWFPIAYNPDLQYVFLNTNQWGMGLTAKKPEEVVYKPGETYMGVDYQMYRMGDTIGRTKAFDLKTRKFVWETPSPLPLFAGLLATKSGLLFTGDLQGFLLALDAKTGKPVWKFQTGSAVNASPITYELDGTQYVAVLSGLGGDPSFYYTAPKGGMLWVFALDGKGADRVAGSPQVIEKALPTFKAQ